MQHQSLAQRSPEHRLKIHSRRARLQNSGSPNTPAERSTARSLCHPACAANNPTMAEKPAVLIIGGLGASSPIFFQPPRCKGAFKRRRKKPHKANLPQATPAATLPAISTRAAWRQRSVSSTSTYPSSHGWPPNSRNRARKSASCKPMPLENVRIFTTNTSKTGTQAVVQKRRLLTYSAQRPSHASSTAIMARSSTTSSTAAARRVIHKRMRSTRCGPMGSP